MLRKIDQSRPGAVANSFRAGILCLVVSIVMSIYGCAPWVELVDSNVKGTEFNPITYEGYENIPYIEKTIKTILDKHLDDLSSFLSDSGFVCNHDDCSKLLYNKMVNHNPIEQATNIKISVLVRIKIVNASSYTLSVVHSD